MWKSLYEQFREQHFHSKSQIDLGKNISWTLSNLFPKSIPKFAS